MKNINWVVNFVHTRCTESKLHFLGWLNDCLHDELMPSDAQYGRLYQNGIWLESSKKTSIYLGNENEI